MTFESHRIPEFALSEGHVIAERYELGRRLGSRDGTLVFLARDLLSGDEIQNPAALKAFKRDLAVLRDDAHPNVVRIYDFGETAGAYYVAMEWIHGIPLTHGAAEGPGWSHDAVCEVLEQLTGALPWLHSRGVVHGNIRTSNILWNDGAIKLMDFEPQRDSRQERCMRRILPARMHPRSACWAVR